MTNIYFSNDLVLTDKILSFAIDKFFLFWFMLLTLIMQKMQKLDFVRRNLKRVVFVTNVCNLIKIIDSKSHAKSHKLESSMLTQGWSETINFKCNNTHNSFIKKENITWTYILTAFYAFIHFNISILLLNSKSNNESQMNHKILIHKTLCSKLF